MTLQIKTGVRESPLRGQPPVDTLCRLRRPAQPPPSRTSVGPGASVAAPLLLTVLSPGTRPHAPSCVDFCSSGDLSQRGVLPRDSAGWRLLPSLQSGLLWVWFPTGHVAEGKVPGRGSGKSRAGLSGLQGAWAQRPDRRAKQVATVTGVIGSGGAWAAHSQASWCSLPHGDWGQMTCRILRPRGPGRSARPASPPRRGDG